MGSWDPLLWQHHRRPAGNAVIPELMLESWKHDCLNLVLGPSLPSLAKSWLIPTKHWLVTGARSGNENSCSWGAERLWRKGVRWAGRMCSPVGARQKKGELRRLGWGEGRRQYKCLEMRISAVSVHSLGKERGENEEKLWKHDLLTQGLNWQFCN